MYFHYKSMVDNDMPGAWPVWTPGAPLAGFIKRSTINCSTQNMKALGHVVSEKKSTIHCSTQNMKALGHVVSEKSFSCIFHYKAYVR